MSALWLGQPGVWCTPVSPGRWAPTPHAACVPYGLVGAGDGATGAGEHPGGAVGTSKLVRPRVRPDLQCQPLASLSFIQHPPQSPKYPDPTSAASPPLWSFLLTHSSSGRWVWSAVRQVHQQLHTPSPTPTSCPGLRTLQGSTPSHALAKTPSDT